MKTLKFLFLLTALSAFWQSGQAQCAKFNLWQYSPGSDTILISPYTLTTGADSASASWTVDFGDGNTETLSGPIWHIYNAIGSFNICLTYSSGLCTSTYCDSIYVQSCGSLNNVLIGQSTSGGLTYLNVSGAPAGSTYNWSFSGGATPSSSTSANPSVTYPANNNYNDYVLVTAPGGCTQYVGFAVNTFSNCAIPWNKQQYANTVNFSPTQYVSGADYQWSFGDGQVSGSFSPNHTYSSYGTYNVCFTVSTAGCTDSVCQTITTSAPVCPSADSLFYMIQSTNGVVDFYPAITDSSQLYSGTTISIDYGDGQTSILNYPHGHQYYTSGSYVVCANFTNSYCNVTQCDTVIIDMCNTATSIVGSLSGSGYYYALTNANPGWSIQWTFPGGSPSTSTSSTEYVTYPVQGNYNAFVEITIPGCAGTDTMSTSVYVSNDSCNANFSYSTYELGVYLSAQDSMNLVNGNAYFNYGDGTSGTSGYHYYGSSGTYAVSYIVHTSYCSDSITKMITITGPPETCSASWYSQTYGKEAAFTSNDSMVGATYAWAFGDGTTSANADPTHTYAAYGTYNVCLKVSKGNCTDSVCHTITIAAPACPGTDSVFTAWHAVNGLVYATAYTEVPLSAGHYSWSAGDGGTGTDSHFFEHTYTASGTYDICLTYTNAYCTVSDCQTLNIDLCQVSSTVQTWRQDSTIHYSVSQANPSWTYQWTFEDGTPATSTDSAPSVIYHAAGVYSGTVEISIPGCSTPVTLSGGTNVPGSVFGTCDAYFEVYTDNLNVGLMFSDTVGLSIGNLSINYGDGVTNSGLYHIYTATGSYSICATLTTPTCTSTVCQNVSVTAPAINIYGMVYKNGSLACNGVVYLIEENAGHLTAIDTFSFNSPDTCQSYYQFTVPDGVYYTKAALSSSDADYADFLPTYHDNELSWGDATAITAQGNYDINLIMGVNPGGPGSIGGNVSEGAGLAAIGNGEERAVGDPIANVQINLLTDNGTAVAYTYTDGNGRYTFNNLPLGGYRVLAEMLDKTPLSQVVTLTANNPSQDNVDVLVNSNSAVTGINDIAELKVDGVFPNPVKDVATIRFTAKLNASATVKVTDMKGSIVSAINTNIVTGNNELKIDLTNYAGGVYTVSITNNYNKKIIKLLKSN